MSRSWKKFRAPNRNWTHDPWAWNFFFKKILTFVYLLSSWYPWTIHHSTTWLTFPSPLNFFQVSRPLATWSLAWSLCDLIEAGFARFACKIQGKFNINWRGRLEASLQLDILKADTNLNKRLKLVTQHGAMFT